MSDLEMFLVRPKPGTPPNATEAIATYAASKGGYVLMVTADRSLVVMMPDKGKQILEANVLVGFVGGVQLNEQGRAHKALEKVFITNVSRQLASARLQAIRSTAAVSQGVRTLANRPGRVGAAEVGPNRVDSKGVER